ncbi:MAG TPA: hypothetical protein VF771_14190 [Longimicrobiaceae bacterium]
MNSRPQKHRLRVRALQGGRPPRRAGFRWGIGRRAGVVRLRAAIIPVMDGRWTVAEPRWFSLFPSEAEAA